VQAPELQHDQEQEEDDRAPGIEQVLPVLPEAHGAQGNEVAEIADCRLPIADLDFADARHLRRFQSAIRNRQSPIP